MKKYLLAMGLIALCSEFGLRRMNAQAATPAAPVATVTRPPSLPQTMDLATAKRMAAAAESAAAAVNQHIAVCIMDTDGDVVLAERMDGVDHTPVITAEGKARASLIFGIPSGRIADAVANKKPVTATLMSVPVGTGGEITLQFRGGLPVIKDGKVIGAIGVGGSASEVDETFAQAAIDAVSRK